MIQVDGARKNTPCSSRDLRHTAKNGKKSPKWYANFIFIFLLFSPTDIDIFFFLFLLQIPSRTIVQIRTHAQKYFQKLEKQKQKEFAHRERWNAMRTQTIQPRGYGPNTLTPSSPVPGRCAPSMLFSEKNSSRGMHMMEMMRQERGMERDQMVANLVASMRWPLPRVAV